MAGVVTVDRKYICDCVRLSVSMVDLSAAVAYALTRRAILWCHGTEHRRSCRAVDVWITMETTAGCAIKLRTKWSGACCITSGMNTEKNAKVFSACPDIHINCIASLQTHVGM